MFGLNVTYKYENNSWFTKGSTEEWPIAYHSIREVNENILYKFVVDGPFPYSFNDSD